MNILHVNPSDLSGGASRAAYRIHAATQRYSPISDVHSRMRVVFKQSDDPAVIEAPLPRRGHVFERMLHRLKVRSAWRGFVHPDTVHHSIAYPDSGLGDELRQWQSRDATNVVHLHWVGEARHRGDVLLSIEEIGRLTGPTVWTLHDQWAFCGAEHYAYCNHAGVKAYDARERFALGYSFASRISGERCRDLNRETWLRKQRSWRLPIQIICPSRWMAECTLRSTLMADWPISVIPNPIDTDRWAPAHPKQARQLLGLPVDRPLVLFGSVGGLSDLRKGGDLLLHAMQILRTQSAGSLLETVELVVFGQSQPSLHDNFGFPVHYLGRLQDDLSLRLAYSAADVFVIPSRQDNLPNTGLEAHACATPVVAFDIGGLSDIVDPGITGALAEPFDAASLAASILWVLEDADRLRQLSAAARQRCLNLWHPRRVASLYIHAYQQAIDR